MFLLIPVKHFSLHLLNEKIIVECLYKSKNQVWILVEIRWCKVHKYLITRLVDI